jgi:hypothetical protein
MSSPTTTAPDRSMSRFIHHIDRFALVALALGFLIAWVAH